MAPPGRRVIGFGGVLALAIAVGAPAAAGPKVPNVVVGPATLDAAPRVDAPIAEVTVYSDRARVRRRGRATIGAGPAVVRLPDLPGAAFVDTVRLAAGGARVLRVEATPVERRRFAIEQARKLLDELDAVNDRLGELEDRVALDDWLISLVTRLAPAPPVPEEKREGRKPLVVDVPSWMKALDFLGERATAARTRLATLVDERNALEERRQKLRADIAGLDQGGFSSKVIEVTAVVDGPAGKAIELELEYFVPGARWKPAYDLHYTSARGQIRLESAAVVEQRTGEDWTDAALSFSTAMPGRGIDLPELLTWTLGERGDFVPQLRAKQTPPVATAIASGPPGPPSGLDAAADVESLIVRDRLAQAMGGSVSVASAGRQEPAYEEKALADRAPDRTRARLRPMSRSAPSAPSAAPASAPAATMEMDLAEEAEAAPPPRAVMQKLVLGHRGASPAEPSSVSVPLALYDETAARRPPPLSDPTLPAVSAGGLDVVYPAPTRATIPSTGREVRIPLASQSFRAAAFYEATPALATTAYLRARVRNDGKRALLRGTATIFGNGELVGVGEIKTTGPGGDIELPLGADQDIRLVRQVVPSSRTTGVILKDEETTYDVQIQVGNYKKQPISIEVMDQLPTSQRDQVVVKLLGTDPALQGAADADGVVRWRVDLPAAATRTLRLRYQIVRPKNWRLYQR